jgi:hypothetical protein
MMSDSLLDQANNIYPKITGIAEERERQGFFTLCGE